MHLGERQAKGAAVDNTSLTHGYTHKRARALSLLRTGTGRRQHLRHVRLHLPADPARRAPGGRLCHQVDRRPRHHHRRRHRRYLSPSPPSPPLSLSPPLYFPLSTPLSLPPRSLTSLRHHRCHDPFLLAASSLSLSLRLCVHVSLFFPSPGPTSPTAPYLSLSNANTITRSSAHVIDTT